MSSTSATTASPTVKKAALDANRCFAPTAGIDTQRVARAGCSANRLPS
jgi:hypothetical protein